MGNFIKAKHWRDLDRVAWEKRWPNFMPYELCSDDGSIKIYIPSLDGLQRVRTRAGFAMNITDAYRTEKHNRRVGGGKFSQHKRGKAYDIAISGTRQGRLIEKLAIEEGFTAIGRYPKRFFIHLDMRPPKPSGALYQWGRW